MGSRGMLLADRDGGLPHSPRGDTTAVVSVAGDKDLRRLWGRDRWQATAELKSDSGRVRPEQEQWLADLREAGIAAFAWRPGNWDAIQASLAGSNIGFAYSMYPLFIGFAYLFRGYSLPSQRPLPATRGQDNAARDVRAGPPQLGEYACHSETSMSS